MKITLVRHFTLCITATLLAGAWSYLPAQAEVDGSPGNYSETKSLIEETQSTQLNKTPAMELGQTRLTHFTEYQAVGQKPKLISEVNSEFATAKSASALQSEPFIAPSSEATEPTNSQTSTAPMRVAQDIDPGRVTRSGPSFIGIAGNIGLTGDSSDLGRGSFAVISKIGLTRFLSVRPAVLINRDVTILVPLTFDYYFQPVGDTGFSVAPYFGGGVAINAGSDSRAGALLSGGVDFPISADLTATAAVNVAFLRNTDVGLFLGVGYTFFGF